MLSGVSPHKQRVGAFYDKLSPHFRRLWGEHLHDGFYETGAETKEAAQEKLVEYLASFSRIPAGGRGLDIGCGMGATSVWLARCLNARMTGITLSPTQVEIAKELASLKGVTADFILADAESYQPDRPFDFAWMVGVLGHFEDQRAFIRRAARLVRSGGRFLLADWVIAPDVCADDRRRYVDPVLKGMLMPDIARLDEYADWFQAHGFRVVESRDITRETAPTWDQGASILQTNDLARLAWDVGLDAVRLIAAIRNMRTAMGRGFIRYGTLVAERAAE